MTKSLIIADRLSATAVVVGIGLGLWLCFAGDDSVRSENSGVREASPRARAETEFAARAELPENTLRGHGARALTDEQIRRLLSEWCRRDPEAAFKFFVDAEHREPEDAFFRAADIAFRAWVEQQPERARAYLEDVSDDARLTAKLAPVLLRFYAERSPSIAQEWLRTGFVDDSGELRPALARELTAILIERGRRADAETWLAADEVAQSAYALPAVDEYSRGLAAKDVEAALAFSEKLPRGTLARALAIQNAVHAWTARDAEQSHEWLARLMAREELPPVRQETNFPAERDPEPAIAPGAYTADELDYAISGYVLALARTSTKEAMESAMSIEDFALRKRIQEQVSAMAPTTRDSGTDS